MNEKPKFLINFLITAVLACIIVLLCVFIYTRVKGMPIGKIFGLGDVTSTAQYAISALMAR